MEVDYTTEEYGLANWGVRAGAILVDLLILGVVSSIVVKALDTSAAEKVAAGIIVVIVNVLYGFVLIGKGGRTWGMRLFSLRLVDFETGSPVSLQSAFIRTLIAICFYGIISEGLFIYIAFQPDGWSSHHRPLVGIIMTVQVALWLFYLIPIVSKKNQTIQDKVVGSVVIRKMG